VDEYKVPVTGLSEACLYGNLEMIHFLCTREQPTDLRGLMSKVAYYGFVDCVKYFHSLGCSINGLFSATKIPVIEYLCMHMNDESSIMNLFAHHCLNDRLEVIKFMYTYFKRWPEKGLENAVHNGSMEVIKYMVEHSCPMDELVMFHAVASKINPLHIVKYLIQQKCPMDQESTHLAARLGRLDLLACLHENNCPWSPKVHSYAAKNGNLEIIKYAYEHGCAWSALTCANAAAGNYMDILTFVHEHGCQWNHRTTQSAARFGHLDPLRYAHERGCPWNEKAMYRAIRFGHLSCVSYLLEHKCPLSMEKALFTANKYYQVEIANFLLQSTM
jgi:hypothetical protein